MAPGSGTAASAAAEGMAENGFHPEGGSESYHPENAAAVANQPVPSTESSTFDKIVGTTKFAIKYLLGDIVNNNLPDNLVKEF